MAAARKRRGIALCHDISDKCWRQKGAGPAVDIRVGRIARASAPGRVGKAGRIALAGLLAALSLPLSPAAAQEFSSPSGNITCLFDPPLDADARRTPEDSEYYVRCDMAEGISPWSAPPAGCDLDWGKSLGLMATGAGIRNCHGDTVLNPRAPVLDYGQTISVPGITCRSERAGVTCTNRQGGGFFLSRLRQRVF